MSQRHLISGLVLASTLAATVAGAQSRYRPGEELGAGIAGGPIVNADASGAGFEVVLTGWGRLDIGLGASWLDRGDGSNRSDTGLSLGVGYAVARPVAGAPFGVEVVAALHHGDVGSASVTRYQFGGDVYMEIPAGAGLTIFPAVGLFYAYSDFDWTWGPNSATEPLVTGRVGLRIGDRVIVEPGLGLLDDDWQGSLAVRLLIDTGGGESGDSTGDDEDDQHPR